MIFISRLFIYITCIYIFSLCRVYAEDLVNTSSLNGETKEVSLKGASQLTQYKRDFTPLLTINGDLLSLIELLKQPVINHYQVDTLLAKLTLSKQPLNAAEQYLLLVVQAKVQKISSSNKPEKLSETHKKNNIIELLSQANQLSPQISEQQLVLPEFLQLHLILAEHYISIKRYDLAYLEKSTYLQKYHIYRTNKRAAMIASLEQSFEVKDKKANNELLKTQNALKVRRVAEVNTEKEKQEYNFTLIITTAIIFFLLFIRQLKIRNKLIKLNKVDVLTGLSNRKSLFEYGNKMLADFKNKPEPLSVLLLDIDHFKRINDSFGDNIGDQVLVIISQLVTETMRSRDIFSRLGGEEFVALLPYADSHKAKAIAMRIHEKISQYDFSTLMLQKHVGISIGIATYEDKNMSFDDLLHCADLAMYQAKEQGRNSVVCYQTIAISQERRAN